MTVEIRRQKLAGGSLFVVEIVPAIGAANQHRLVPDAPRLSHVGGDVADGEADAAMIGSIGLGVVRDLHMMQRHFAGLQGDIDDLVEVDVDGDLLAARQ